MITIIRIFVWMAVLRVFIRLPLPLVLCMAASIVSAFIYFFGLFLFWVHGPVRLNETFHVTQFVTETMLSLQPLELHAKR